MTEVRLVPDAIVAGVAARFGALADTTRLRLVLLIAASPDLSVGTLAERLRRPRGIVAQHLARLRAHGLLDTALQGRRLGHRLADPHTADLVGTALHYAETLAAHPPRPAATTPAPPCPTAQFEEPRR
ncbi:metalloregulator ArsR/SmtB family transcription factor [Microbacterium sp. 13-71-7]|jgi:DNA-binding transcriptional ArsR family regulator|uniref:ArsR/SmtB family transcription factor n=1 Tax=Microbacterium sp. 13-71-7 TaxID=1970399 RepID=UPI000BD11F9F|nr:metalloregulator ArsR/SmtB family transcription factor [Microbacterium sp. 13-71-7]OZB80296.1 MAG: hypothetical protein B7X32_19740 [Microbacterium sp. 13-71-7]